MYNTAEKMCANFRALVSRAGKSGVKTFATLKVTPRAHSHGVVILPDQDKSALCRTIATQCE